jgi:hypothetical protein
MTFEGWTNSLFIPAIDMAVTKNDLKKVFEDAFEVTVKRVDFAAFNSDNGSGRRAFVHFENWEYANMYANTVIKRILEDGYYIMYNPKYGNGVNPTLKHLRLLINKNPVPETEQTIQQVASNVDFMAEKIRLQEETIQKQQEEIDALKQQMENIYHFMVSKIGAPNASTGKKEYVMCMY